MRLETLPGSENYQCTVVKLPPKQKVEGLDRLVKVTVFGNDVLTKVDAEEDQLYLFFPAECAISNEYLSANNEFRESTLNRDQSQKGYFEPTGRVKSIKFKGIISTGYISPLSSLQPLLDVHGFKVGDEFNCINGHVLCKKYKVKRQQGQAMKEVSRYNKKLKRFNRLVPNQFRFHTNTSPLAKNFHMFNPEDIIAITDKWHGTSAVFANVLVKRKPNWLERATKFVFELFPGVKVDINDKVYDNLYSSRSVLKNQYINTKVTAGYYNEDIWGVVNKELEGKVEQGISLYGEIVGYLPSGKEIQKGYDYSCSPGLIKSPESIDDILAPAKTDMPEHKFLVYRITYTKPDGNIIEFSWQQVKEYCKKYSIEHVKELYFGKFNMVPCGEAVNLFDQADETSRWRLATLQYLQDTYLEKDCTYCKNKVPAEGICVRIDGRESYMTYELKSKRFLERETKELDAGVVSIEEEEVTAEIIQEQDNYLNEQL